MPRKNILCHMNDFIKMQKQQPLKLKELVDAVAMIQPMGSCSSLNSEKNGNLIVLVGTFSYKGSIYHPFQFERG